jgi:hypothetical protein
MSELSTNLPAKHTLGDDQLNSPVQSAIQMKGWKVRKIKEGGGCYEVYGTTPEGKRVEAYFDPVTLEKLLVAQRGTILFEKK